MPFPPGYKHAGPGRPKKGLTIRDLLKAQPIKDKKALVAKAYQMAIDGDVRFMEFVAKHSGEGANLIEDVREAGGTLDFTLHLDSPMETDSE